MSIIEGYDWAQNRDKLRRAIEELKEQDKEVNDKSVKEVYKRLLGHVIEEKEDEDKDEEENLDSMNKAELVKLAEDKDIETDGLTKAEIIEALEE